MPATTPLARGLATATALVALVALAMQLWIAATAANRPPGMAAWWWLAGYFTILTNLAVAALMGRIALGSGLSARVQGGLVLSILMVGLVYHALLARLWAPRGLAWWTDQALHSATPLLTLVWWLGFGDRRVGLHDLPVWLGWPALYAVYALLRGAATGFWPYPFLDADRLGWAEVAGNLAGMVLAFAALGLVLIALARVSVR
ncbi:Pr6Pr family membrane protein [Rhodobacter calidifons]|uniref:FAR-17a/AIG1-like protein n=1 Tax=Rhodobacter calidifons TaxID=2715277 RepID=A0ABX0G507_9RHOB|nr:Pr6Pr family membrane protein [Rhodobacter calidifons]NHB76176.1 hypothetical protein [Rhodobacter calidifons]